jgi:hypothetical protein
MPQDFGFKLVTLDAGDGPVNAVMDTSGRVITAEQMDSIRQRQETDLAQVTDLRDKLAAGDATATAQVVSQYKDGLTRQLTVLDKQKTDAAATLAKLEANDAPTVADVVKRMADQVGRRVEMVTAARDRSVEVLAQIAPDGVGVVVKPVGPAPVTPATPAVPAATPATPVETPAATPVG